MTDRGDTDEAAAVGSASDDGASSASTAHNAHATFPDWGSASDFDDSGLEELISEHATSRPARSTASGSSELGDTLDDDWRSLTSSIVQHNFENGREEELREVFSELLDGRHFISPIDEGAQKIVDLGCGDGRWASEVAELFPGAEVVAMDISPIQPVFAPPNLTTRLADIETDLEGVSDMPSDLVHLERVAPYLRRPKDLMKTILTNLRPGGWVEFKDMQTKVFSDDAPIPPENGLAYAAYLFNKSQKEKFGFDLDTAWNLPQALREARGQTTRGEMARLPAPERPPANRGASGAEATTVSRPIAE
ncbi:hypothetical protein PG997_007954 [Apiospora hydei]|uniref:Methyltransferase domain-containing protein n=1 Tax=Apiospora hydei TaxID=1337664 RepID=A0ABR1WC92_9PEZI